MPSPLTLDCACPGSDALQCEVTRLRWVGNFTKPSGGWVLSIVGDTLSTNADEGAFDMDLDVETAILEWGSLKFRFTSDRSLNSNAVEHGFASWRLIATVTCGNGEDESTQEIEVTNNEADEEYCSSEEFFVKAVMHIGPGKADGYIFHSKSIDPCNGATAESGSLTPDLSDVSNTIDITDQSVCLCATDGNPPYNYWISEGRLPSGMSVDRVTGCIVGQPDGLIDGTDEVTFMVFDTRALAAPAYATCRFLKNCADVEAFGNEMF